MKKTKTIMLIAAIAMIAVIFANAIANVFFPEKPDEPVIFTITVENCSGIEFLGYGISYGTEGEYITTEYAGYAGKKIKTEDVFEFPFYESILGTTDVSSFIFSLYKRRGRYHSFCRKRKNI